MRALHKKVLNVPFPFPSARPSPHSFSPSEGKTMRAEKTHSNAAYGETRVAY